MSIDIKASRAICDEAKNALYGSDAESKLRVHARTALPAALDEIERLREALTVARQGLRDCRYAVTPAQADEWATDALLRSSIEEHLVDADTGGEE